jgi:F420-dependent oxidoreductase-like protein
MRLRIFTEPQLGATYDRLLAVARCTQEQGFDAFFRSDHYLTMGQLDGLPGPTDAWTTLAGLARDTEGIRLGTLVTSATFRLPGPLAIVVAQVDAMSGGRAELGLGAGWYEAEHRAYSIPFPPRAERFDRLEEQLAIITGLWRTPLGSTFDFTGRYYQLAESPALPKPVQVPNPPVIVGGAGPKRTPRLAALFADEYNSPFLPLARATEQYDLARKACETIGRDPDTLRFSAAMAVCCGVDEAELARRAARIGRGVDELRENGLCGTPDELVEVLARWSDAGVTTFYLQVLDLEDLDHIRLIGEQVLPPLR